MKLFYLKSNLPKTELAPNYKYVLLESKLKDTNLILLKEEIIRFFELQKTIRLQKTSSGNIAVDVPDDIEKVESILSARRNQ